MGYYKDLRSALNSTKMGDINSREHKLIMEAKKTIVGYIILSSS